MSPDRDSERLEGQEPEIDEYEVETRRSIFSVLWFRALLVVLVLGVIAAVAVPYVRDVTTQPGKTPAANPTAAAPAPPSAPAPARAAPAPAITAAPSPATATPPTAAPAPAAPKTAPARMTKAFEAPSEAAKEAPKATPKQMVTSPASKLVGAMPSSPAAAPGPYWVQVGAFKDPDTAKRLAARLREQGFRVEQSTTTTGGAAPAAVSPASPSDRYNVLVSNASAADVDARLAAKGMTSESTAGGVVVQPSLPLREAINLSRDLSDAGLSVQVRRAGGPAPGAVGGGNGGTLHRVRVGGFTDRPEAMAALKRLQAKGFTPFIARGKP